ncbi:hypothetical protein V3C99_016449, partial [Haemonchus contortus]
RIFINRSLRMDKIKCVGFDMDATLAIYNSPITEELAFTLSIQRLVDIGYPKEIQGLKYRTNFVVRNAWFDKRFGNLLKTDEHCNILTAFHGFKKLDKKEIRQYYPNKHINLEESRIFVLNTVFNVPETFLLASVIDYFEHRTEYEKLPLKEGYSRKDTQQVLLYSAIFDDCRKTIDWIHTMGNYKEVVIRNLSAYVAQDSRAVEMMQMLSQSGKKLFLLTNSPWLYTNILMSHIMGRKWQQLFDVVIVNGNKPKWFLQDIPFKEVDPSTGTERIGSHRGLFRKGEIYSRGCASDFKRQMDLAGKDILYVGDHIFGDVLKSKKAGGWRTLLIVPELDREMRIWCSQKKKFYKLIALNNSMLASKSAEGMVKKDILKEITYLTEDMEADYGAMGSLLRCGWRQTYFASQLKKYADIYTCNAYNIAEYSPLYYFNSPLQLLSHEEVLMKNFDNTTSEDSEEVRPNEKIHEEVKVEDEKQVKISTSYSLE